MVALKKRIKKPKSAPKKHHWRAFVKDNYKSVAKHPFKERLAVLGRRYREAQASKT
jgi:hypothetical protein